MLEALLEGLGCVVTDFGIRPDREAALADTLAAASAEHDLIVTSGGRLDRRGGSCQGPRSSGSGALHFWRLAIKPGRPVALGQVAGVPLIGLPGNPVAVAVTFAVLARPLILKLAGAAGRARRGCFRCAPASPIAKSPGGANICARGWSATAIKLVAVKYARDGAGILSSIVQSDGLVILDEATGDLAAGTMVDFLPFSEVIG